MDSFEGEKVNNVTVLFTQSYKPWKQIFTFCDVI